MASTTLKKYSGKSQKSRLDIFDDFFNQRPTKKLNPLIAKLELPEKDGSFLASDSLHVSTEDAFDKLRKGPLLNDVNIVNSFKKLESSDSDFTVPDVGYPDLFPPIQKKSVRVGRFYRKRKVTQDLPNVEKCPEQLNIKKRKFESKFKKPSIVLKDTSNFEITQEIRPKFCSTPINHKNKSTHQNNSPICVFSKNDTQHTNSNASRSRFSTPDNVTKRSNNSAIKQLNLSDPGIVSKNNTDLTTNLLTSLRKSLSEPQSCISLKENSKESVEKLCRSENRISESLSGSHENITKRSSNRELKNKYLYVLLKNSPIANNLEKEHGTAKNSIISINNTDLTAESFKLQENALNFPASNDKGNVFAVSVQGVQKADKNLYVLSENVTNNKQLDKECNQEITSNSILSIDNIDLNKVCDQEMTKFKKPSILVDDTTNLNFEIGQEIRPTFCSTPINQKHKNTHQKNSPICVFSKNDTQHTNRKASRSRFSTPDNVSKRSNNSVIKQLNLSDPGIVSKNNTDLTSNLLTSLRKSLSESQSCISLKENSKESVEELCRSENRFSKSLSGSHENITKRSSNRELKNKYLYVLLENSPIANNLEKEHSTAKNSIISINNTDLIAESFKCQENAPNFQTSNDKGNDFEVSNQEVQKADKNLYVLSENVRINKQLDKECNQEITSNSFLSIDNTDLDKECHQEMTKFKKPSIAVEDTTNLNFEIGQEIRPTFCSTPINQKNKNTHQNNSPICVFSKNDTKHTNSKASRSRFSTPDNVTKRSNKSAIKQLNLSDPGIVSKNNTDLTTNLLTSLRKSVSESQSCISLKENSKELVGELCRSENSISKSLSGSHENITKRNSKRELKNNNLYILLENPPIANNLEKEHGTAKNSIISINNTDLTAESFKWQENAPNFQTSNDKGNDLAVSIQEVQKADKYLYVLSENVTSNKQLDNKCNQEMTSNSILSIDNTDLDKGCVQETISNLIFSTDNTDLTAESVNEICSANTSVFLSSNGEKTDFEKSIQEPQKTDKNLYVLLDKVTINKYLDKECDQETTSNSILSIDNTDLTAESVNTSVFLSSNGEKTNFEKSIQEPQKSDKKLYVLLKNVTINTDLDKECDQETTSNSILTRDNTDLTAESVNTSVFLSSNGEKTDFEKSIQEPQKTDKYLYVLLENMTISKYVDKGCDQETTSNSILSIDNTDLTAESVNTSVFLSSNGEKTDFEKSIQEPQKTDKNLYVLLDKVTINKYLDKECDQETTSNSILSIDNTDLTAESVNTSVFLSSNGEKTNFEKSIQEPQKSDKKLYVLLKNVTINTDLDKECDQETTSNSILTRDNTDLTAESVNTSVFLSSNGEKTDFEKSIQEPQKTDKYLYVLLENMTISKYVDKGCDQETTSNSILSIDNTDLTAESVNTSVFLSSNSEKTDFEKSIQEPQKSDKKLYVLLKNVTINTDLDKECDQETTSNSILTRDNTDLTAESVNTSVFLSSNGEKTDFEKSIQEPQKTDKYLYVLLENMTISKYVDKGCDQETTSNSILSIDNTDLTAESVNTSVFLSSNGEKTDFEKSIQEPQKTDKYLYVLLENMTISKYVDKGCVNHSVKNCDQGMSTLSIDKKIKETQSSSHTDESVKSYKDNSVFQSTNKISRSLSSSHENITKRSHENITKRSHNSTNTSAIKCKELCVLLEKKSTKHEQPVINDTANHSVISIQEETNEKKGDSVMSVILEDDECLMPQPIITKKSVRFKPGKSWRRSLSMHQNSIILDETTHCTCADSSCSCGKCQISRLSRAQIKRCSIRVLPISTEKSSRRTTILQDYAKTSYVPDQDIVDSHLENSVRSLSISSRNTKYKKSVSVVTAREVVLRRCGQTEPLPFDECYPSSALKNCQKIGEGVYGEVFLYKNQNGQTTVMKVIPIEGDLIINGERQKKFQEILSEVIIAMELSNLRNSKKNSTCGFSEVQKIRCVQGCYPERLLDLWNLYEETKGTENDSPEVFNEDQLYIVLELANGGKDLEAYQFTNAQQAFSMFQQVACSLAVAENQLHFEHRDLHWGNILLSTVDKRDKQTFCLDGRVIEVPTLGVSVAIIDFTLSRIEYDGVVIFNDLSVDPDLFTGEGDYQFEIYRQMQTKNSNKWHVFEPYTNLLWLHYTLDKAITALHYKNTKSKLHKEYLTKMKSIKDYLLNYNSVKEFVLDYFN